MTDVEPFSIIFLLLCPYQLVLFNRINGVAEERLKIAVHINDVILLRVLTNRPSYLCRTLYLMNVIEYKLENLKTM